MQGYLAIERHSEQTTSHSDVAHVEHIDLVTPIDVKSYGHDSVGGLAPEFVAIENETEPLLPNGSLAGSSSFLASSQDCNSPTTTTTTTVELAGAATITSGSGRDGAFDGFISPLHDSDQLKSRPHVSLFYCVSFVVSSVIGSGIFASPGIALDEVGSVGAAFCLWVVGAFMSICSCLISAELGSSFPDQLADARFLHEAFGDGVSLSFIWTVLVVQNSASLSIQALIIADYLVPHSLLAQKFLAIACMLSFTAIALVGVSMEEKVQLGINSSRATLVALFVAAAGVSLRRDTSIAYNNFFRGTFVGTKLKGVGNGLIAVLWAYSGSGAIVALAPFMAKPNRDLPLALGIGMSMVMIAYVLLNVSYLCVLPTPEVAKSEDLAKNAARRAFGEYAADVVGVLVAMSVGGNLQSSLRYGALTLQGAAFRGKIPAWFGKGTREPAAALVYECLSSIVLILIGGGNVKRLMNFFGVLFGTFVFLSAVAAIKLRFDKPFHTRRVLLPPFEDGGAAGQDEAGGGGGEGGGVKGDETSGGVISSPFKMPFFPLEPLVILAMSVMLVVTAALEERIGAVVSVLMLAIPYPLYRLIKRYQRRLS